MCHHGAIVVLGTSWDAMGGPRWSQEPGRGPKRVPVLRLQVGSGTPQKLTSL